MDIENIDNLISYMMRILSTEDLTRALSLLRGAGVKLEPTVERSTRLLDFLKPLVSERDLNECGRLMGFAEQGIA